MTLSLLGDWPSNSQTAYLVKSTHFHYWKKIARTYCQVGKIFSKPGALLLTFKFLAENAANKRKYRS